MARCWSSFRPAPRCSSEALGSGDVQADKCVRGHSTPFDVHLTCGASTAMVGARCEQDQDLVKHCPRALVVPAPRSKGKRRAATQAIPVRPGILSTKLVSSCTPQHDGVIKPQGNQCSEIQSCCKTHGAFNDSETKPQSRQARAIAPEYSVSNQIGLAMGQSELRRAQGHPPVASRICLRA